MTSLEEGEEEGLEEEWWCLHPDQHQRTILHLDVDCFYAQVEMVLDPSLRHKPLGIKQKNLMVTCNYVARSMGVKKTMWIKEAMEILPELVLVDGSDLTHYRQCSANILAVAQTFTDNVEKLGMDENFLDVTDIVKDWMDDCGGVGSVAGHVFGDKECDGADVGDPCGCGCRQRLMAGALIAEQVRQQILEETGITCCAGVAHNKLLAKLVSGYHKPNQQTVIFPWQVKDMMNSVEKAGNIPGIGSAMCKTLEELGIVTVKHLQDVPLNLLQTKFDKKLAMRLKNVSFGIDDSPVKRSGRPQSIGLEDAFRKVRCETEVKVKYQTLLERLLRLLAADGRVPTAIRVYVRKSDANKKFGLRESRQASISPSLFAAGVKSVDGVARATLLKVVMGLFQKMVGSAKDCHLTLVGVAFIKFIDRVDEAKSIASFFSKQVKAKDKEQTSNVDCSEDSKLNTPEDPIVSLPGMTGDSSLTDSVVVKSGSTLQTKLPKSDKLAKGHHGSGQKKCKNFVLNETNNIRAESSGAATEVFSSEASSDDHIEKSISELSPQKSLPNSLSASVDPEVFQCLPSELKEEILDTYSADKESTVKAKQVRESLKKVRKGVDSYFIRQSKAESSLMKKRKLEDNSAKVQNLGENRDNESAGCSYQSTSSNDQSVQENLHDEKSLHSLLASSGIDLSVFSALPEDIKQEIIQEQKNLQKSPNKQSRTPVQAKARQSPSVLRQFRKRGRPRRTWNEVIQRDLRDIGFDTQAARDRAAWRASIR